jgi:alpha-beta hydrolase superfamily lysophospholipase
MLITKKIIISTIISAILVSSLPLTAGASANKTFETQKSGGAKGSNKSKLPIWSNNIKVPYRSWIPVEKPSVVLLCIHGLGFSSESFTEFGRTMASRGLAVYALDVRGFGEWMKRDAGNQVDFEASLSDIESALRTLHKAYAKDPVFLIGESMGGAIALRATSRYPELVNGLVCSVPSSDRYAKLSSELVVGTRYLQNKDKQMNIAPEVMNRATANPNLRAKWAAEPTNRMKMTPKELKQFNDFMKGNEDAAALVANVPVMMLAGFKDKLVKPEGTISLFNQLSTQDKLLMIVGDGEHLLLEENQLSDQLAQLVMDWINNEAHSSRAGVTAHP